ncbi:MAG TPA: energy-coupled thiamine transporter ThiT [Firmicutes bacterium]|nr:energy-coupled thiamine transporter ThiT [Candidatus Fermentithermobacillaceae bacterium]
MRNKKLAMIVEGALMVALAFVLSFAKIYQAPYGGSVTLGSMIPILVFALRYGTGPGLLIGTVYGFTQLIIEPSVVHPVQLILDYPLAFGLLGLAGLFQDKPTLGVSVGIGGRFVSHFISGVIWWGIYAPEGMNEYVYSLVYNGGYLVPELVISAVIVKYVLRQAVIQKVGVR